MEKNVTSGQYWKLLYFFVHEHEDEDEVSSNEMHAEQDIISIRGRNDVIHLINSYY